MRIRAFLAAILVLLLLTTASSSFAFVDPGRAANGVFQTDSSGDNSQVALLLIGLALVLAAAAIIVTSVVYWKRSKQHPPADFASSSGPDTRPLDEDFYRQYGAVESQQDPYPHYTSMPTHRSAEIPMFQVKATQKAYLLEVSVPTRPVHALALDLNTMGTDPDQCHLVFMNDAQIAPLQAHIVSRDGAYWLANRAGANDTNLTLNGQVVQCATQLSDGDEILLGVQTRLLFRVEIPPAQPIDDGDWETEIDRH